MHNYLSWFSEAKKYRFEEYLKIPVRYGSCAPGFGVSTKSCVSQCIFKFICAVSDEGESCNPELGETQDFGAHAFRVAVHENEHHNEICHTRKYHP